jgi:ABC-type sugar transport system permease subunit
MHKTLEHVSESQSGAVPRSKRRKTSLTRQRERIGMLSSLPALIFVIALMFFPIGFATWLSFEKTNGVYYHFIGLKNYTSLFSSPLVHQVFRTNLKFLIAIPVVITLGSLTSVLLYQEIYGWRFYRFVFFLPSVLSASVTGIIFRTAFTYDGPVNSALKIFGFQPINFLVHANSAIFVISLALIWAGFGYAMLILLSGLTAIDSDLFLAAQVDGAGWWRQFQYIVIPSIRNQLVFVTTINIMYTFTSLFGFIFVMTAGGPLFSTTTVDYLVFQKAFSSQDMGQGSALAILVFGIIALLTLTQAKYLRTDAQD